jgi:hypothetical protein
MGSGIANSKLSLVDRDTLEERQLTGVIIVSAKSSILLYTRAGK